MPWIDTMSPHIEMSLLYDDGGVSSSGSTPRYPRGIPAVFIDKDGTLIEDVPYNVDPALIRFNPGAIPALRLLNRAGLPVVVVSNQAGLSSGRFTHEQFVRLQQALTERVWLEAGVQLAGFYVCPHAPRYDGGVSCACRKPAPGLLHAAAARHGFDLSHSWMIGDILDDVEAGKRAGCRAILLDTGNETLWRLSPLRMPHYRSSNMVEAAQIVVHHLLRPELP